MTTGRIRLAGVACAIGGALWVVVIMAAAVAPEAIHDSVTGFRIWEALLGLVQALLLVGVVGLAWSGAAGPGWTGRIGLGLALLGRVSFLLGEVRSFAQGSEDELLLPLGALLTGLGMVVAGIAIVRARRWDGWRRAIPLLAGLYPFVAMFPFFAITGEPPIPMIALWGLPWLVLGIALRAEAAAAAVAHGSAAAMARS
jgi:hypothetical protein